MLKKLILLCALVMLITIAGCNNNHTEQGDSVISGDDVSTIDVDAPTSINPADYVDISYIDFPDAPSEYQEILNEYRIYTDCTFAVKEKYGKNIMWDKFEYDNEIIKFGEIQKEWLWLNILILQSENKDDFGYGLKDINGDGSPELFLMTTNNKYHFIDVWEIYLICQGEPIHLFRFAERQRCEKIDEDGTIHYYGSGGATSGCFESYQIAKGGDSISLEGIDVCGETDFSTDPPSTFMRYAYYSNDDLKNNFFDSRDSLEKKELNAKEGELIYQRLSGYESSGNVAPFIDFIPLFK